MCREVILAVIYKCHRICFERNRSSFGKSKKLGARLKYLGSCIIINILCDYVTKSELRCHTHRPRFTDDVADPGVCLWDVMPCGLAESRAVRCERVETLERHQYDLIIL